MAIICCSLSLVGCFFDKNDWEEKNSTFVEAQEYWNSSEVSSNYNAYFMSIKSEQNDVTTSTAEATIIKKGANYDGKIILATYNEGSMTKRYEIYLKDGVAYVTEHTMGAGSVKFKFNLDWDNMMNGSYSSAKEIHIVNILGPMQVYGDVVSFIETYRLEYISGTNKTEEVEKGTKKDKIKFDIDLSFTKEAVNNELDFSVVYENNAINSHSIEQKYVDGEYETEYELNVSKYSGTITFPDLTQYEQ